MRAIKMVTTLVTLAFFADLYLSINRSGLFDLDMSLMASKMLMEQVLLTDRSLIWLAILIVLYIWNTLNYQIASQDKKLDKAVRIAALDVARRDGHQSTEDSEPAEPVQEDK